MVKTLQKHNMVRYIMGETERRFPISDQMNDEWWRIKKITRNKGGKRQRREKARSKREIKRTSVENDCLFDEGWLRSDKVKRALLWRVWSPKRGKIGRTNRRRGQNMWKERNAEGGKDRKRANAERAAALKKNIWEPSGSREKNAGLSWNSRLPLATLLAYLPASYPTNTFPQKTQRRGRREQRESLSSASSHSPQTTRSAVKVHRVLLTDGIRLRSTHHKTL